jgi:hypothetical protein
MDRWFRRMIGRVTGDMVDPAVVTQGQETVRCRAGSRGDCLTPNSTTTPGRLLKEHPSPPERRFEPTPEAEWFRRARAGSGIFSCVVLGCRRRDLVEPSRPQFIE